jgi:hypothetical protein
VTRELALAIVLVLLAWALFALWRGWRRRVSDYRDLPVLAHSGGAVDQWFSVLYVATTEVGKPMERVAKAPLSFRGKTRMGVSAQGVTLDIAGEGDAFIPAQWVSGAGVATWTIDKAVDTDGLVFMRWKWGELAVESYFRVVDHPRDEVLAALTEVSNTANDGKGRV